MYLIFQSDIGIPTSSTPKPSTSTIGFKLVPSQKGVENAKKRLRAFSIQKKSPMAPVPVPKAISGGSKLYIDTFNNSIVNSKSCYHIIYHKVYNEGAEERSPVMDLLKNL